MSCVAPTRRRHRPGCPAARLSPLGRPTLREDATPMDQMVTSARPDPFHARATLTTTQGTTFAYYRLATLAHHGLADIDRLPFTVRILLENALRHAGGEFVSEANVEALARWEPMPAADAPDVEIPFLPGRVILQD